MMQNNKSHNVEKDMPSKENKKDKENLIPNNKSISNQKSSYSLQNIVIDRDFIDSTTSNPYGRFTPSSQKRSYAVITPNPDDQGHWNVGHLNLSSMPNSDIDRPLHNATITLNSHNQPQTLRAHTPTFNTAMIGTIDRGLEFMLDEQGISSSGVILPLSPDTHKRKSKKTLVVFKDPEQLSAATTKHKHTTVYGKDVYYRSNRGKKRRCSQKKIMGNTSAKSTMRIYGHNNDSILTIESADFLKQTKKAEWLHLIAHSLTPQAEDPQQRANIGAALPRDNTKMMVIENIAKVLSQYDDVGIHVDAHFLMLPHSEIIKDIHYSVELHYKNTSLTLFQHTNVFSSYEHPRASDQMLLLAAIALLTGKEIQFQHSNISRASDKEADETSSALSFSTTPIHHTIPKMTSINLNQINAIHPKEVRSLKSSAAIQSPAPPCTLRAHHCHSAFFTPNRKIQHKLSTKISEPEESSNFNKKY